MSDWSAEQYRRFQEERSQPAYDLMDLISHRSSMRIVDLGCGTGDHTRTLHERFRSSETIGIDSSPDMLSKAPRAVGLKFYRAGIEEFGGDSEFDLVFSNAALHWVGGHRELFARFRRALRPGGQLAVQIPRNAGHISQETAYALEKMAPFDRYPSCPLAGNTLAPEAYAELLHELGFRAIKVRLYVYLHQLPSSEEVVEWMRGSLLNWYKAAQPPEVFAEFERDYRSRIIGATNAAKPYLFTYKRILMHAVR